MSKADSLVIDSMWHPNTSRHRKRNVALLRMSYWLCVICC